MDTDYFFMDIPLNKDRADTKRVFIVDDDEPIRDIVTDILQGAGYLVDSFASGMQAVKHALVMPPNVIVLDYFLPGEDTNDIVAKFHLLDGIKHVPIILTSASHLARKSADEWHVKSFLAKPFQAQTLLQAINECDK